MKKQFHTGLLKISFTRNVPSSWLVHRYQTAFFFLFLLLFPSLTYAQQDSVVNSSPQPIQLFPDTIVKSQAKDTTLSQTMSLTDSATISKGKTKRHSPAKAALFSLALPGLGQGYNKKYWKIPIVYAGLGGLGYAVYYTRSNFVGYRNAYRLEVDEDPATVGSYKGVSNPNELREYRDYFKRNLDISAIFTGVWYILNIVDAAVDAHLFEWNMKDDLNVSWQPALVTPGLNQPQSSVGVKFMFNF